jgi:hypothetical protein
LKCSKEYHGPCNTATLQLTTRGPSVSPVHWKAPRTHTIEIRARSRYQWLVTHTGPVHLIRTDSNAVVHSIVWKRHCTVESFELATRCAAVSDERFEIRTIKQHERVTSFGTHFGSSTRSGHGGCGYLILKYKKGTKSKQIRMMEDAI